MPVSIPAAGDDMLRWFFGGEPPDHWKEQAQKTAQRDAQAPAPQRAAAEPAGPCANGSRSRCAACRASRPAAGQRHPVQAPGAALCRPIHPRPQG